jgi:hypothetical protein
MPIVGSFAGASARAYGLGAGLAIPTGFNSISTLTVGGTAQSTLEFTSIPQTYKHLQLRVFARGSSIDAFRIQFNGDTATNYSFHYLFGARGGSSGSSNGTTQSYGIAMWSMGMPNAASTFGFGIYDILDYKDTNKYKTVRGFDGWDANGSGGIGTNSSNWRSTSAITSIKLFPSTGGVTFQQYSTFALYGIEA